MTTPDYDRGYFDAFARMCDLTWARDRDAPDAQLAAAIRHHAANLHAANLPLPCEACHGKGWYAVWVEEPPGEATPEREDCPSCDGTGIEPTCDQCDQPLDDGACWGDCR